MMFFFIIVTYQVKRNKWILKLLNNVFDLNFGFFKCIYLNNVLQRYILYLINYKTKLYIYI